MKNYLSEDSLKMCYHNFCTQKNESLNRKATAMAPKDRFYGGTASLSDRLKMVAIIDSIGYEKGMKKVLINLGLDFNSVINDWSIKKDNENHQKQKYKQRKKTRKKRSQTKLDNWNIGLKMSDKDMNAAADYSQGIGINNVENLCFINIENLGSAETTFKPSELPNQQYVKKNEKTPCKCGSEILHYRKNHKSCLWKK